MQTFYISLLFAALISNSYLLFNLRKSILHSYLVASFALFIALINIWAVGQLLMNTMFLGDKVFRHLNMVASIGWVNLPVAFFVFTLIFTKQTKWLKHPLFLFFIVIPELIFQYLTLTTDLIHVSRFPQAHLVDWGYFTPFGPVFPFFLSWFEMIFVVSLYLIIKVYRETLDKNKKQQALLISVSILIPLVCGTITDGISPIIGLQPVPLAIPLTTVMAGIVGYAIIKYELFSIEPSLILSSIGEGVITVDKHLRVISINKVAEKITGYVEKESLYTNILDILKLEDNNGNLLGKDTFPAFQAITQRQLIEDRYTMHTKTGAKISIALNATPIIINKETVGATLIFTDITKHEQKDQLKDDFISIAAHEIASPVASLQVASYLLEKKLQAKGDTELSQYVRDMTNQIEDLMRLVIKVLDFSKIKSNTLYLEREWIDIATLIHDTTNAIKKRHPQITVKIEGFIHKQVFVDKQRIEEVLLNYLSNAVKYAPTSKEIVIKILQENRDIIIGVHDFGIGIDKGDIKQLFQRYHRLGNNQTYKRKGLGLGLYISREIIRSHGGETWVKSEKGEGSTFYISLPLATDKTIN